MILIPRFVKSFLAGCRNLLVTRQGRQRAALLACAMLAPACGSGGGGGGVVPNPGTIGFSQAVFQVNETGPTATITVSRLGGTLGAVSINYATSDGTAAAGADYTAASGTLSWASGDAADKTFTVPITNDVTIEGDESVNLTLSLPTGGSALGGQSTAALTIVDNDAPAAGVVQFSSATYSVTEGTPSVTITVTRTGGTTGAASVTYSNPAGGTATGGGTDYTFTGATLNWIAGDGASKTFTIAINDDALAEGTETVNLLLSGATGAALGTTSTAVLSIVDNDSSGSLEFSAATYSVNETGAVATITATRTGGVGGGVGVSYTTSNGSGTAGTDYTTATGTLAWAAGDSSSKTFSVFISDNLLPSGDHTVNLTLSTPTGGATLGAQSTAVLTIQDDDSTLQFSAPTYNLAENVGIASITVTRVGSTLSAVSVDFSNPAGGTAAGTDYTFTAGTLNWAVGDGASKTISIPVNSDSLSEGNETLNLLLSNPLGVGASLGVQVAAVATIVDDDVTLGFSAGTSSVSEAGTNATLTVNRVGASVGAASVIWTVTSGTATNPADFTGVTTGTLNWASGDVTAKTIVIPIVSDSLAEGDETIVVTLSVPTLAGGNAVLGANPVHTLTIVDDDVNLAFSSATYSVAENVGGGTLTVTVNRSGLSTGACSVVWSIPAGGTATGGGADYTATPATLNWAAGDSAPKTFTITLVNDLLAEGAETINLALGTPVGATLGAVNTSVVTITDDDLPGALSYTAATFTVAESVGNALVTVSRTGGVGNAVSATWTVTGGSATTAVDFTGPVTGTVSWAAGDAANKTITIPIVDDFAVEGTETITFSLTAPTGGATIGGQPTTTLNITDNDVPGSIQFTNATYSASEGSGVLNVTVSRTGGVGNAVSVDWSITGGTAIGGGTDYTAVPATLNWAAGDGANKNISIALTPDTAVEATETILLLIANATNGATLGGQQTATVNILDDDTNIQFTSATYSANENAGTLTATVTRTGVTTGASQVTWSIPAGGTATGGGVDYTATPGLISWAAGDATPKTITITLVDDFLLEGSETINLALSAPTGGTLGALTTAVATIVDDDAPGSLQFSSATYSVNEGNVNATITVTRTGGVGGTVGVSYATNITGTATVVTDFTNTFGLLSWGPGDATSKTFNIPILSDTLTEGSETVGIDLTTPTGGATLGAPNAAVLTIIDSPGVLSFSSSTYSVNENVGAGFVTITVNRNNGSGGAVSVQYATSNGTAVSGSDYTTATAVLGWADGDTAPKTFNVPILNDTVGESDETVNLTLSNLTGGAGFGANSTAVLTIVDDDTSLVFSSSTYSVNENVGSGFVTITVNRLGVLTNAIGVTYTAAAGTATAADFTPVTSTLSWAGGDGAPKTFNVAISDDAIVEGSETVSLALSLPTGGATLGAPNTATLTIIDDDVPGQLQLSSSTYSVNENGGTASISMTRTGGSGGSVTATLTSSNGTAVAGSDYTAVNQVVSWAAGDTATKTVLVTIANDSLVEGSETVNFSLNTPTGGATIGVPGTAVLTILDDDTSIQFSAATYTVGEGGGIANVTVTRLGNLTNAVSVTCATSNGTATAGSDYVTTSSPINFAAGDGASKTFSFTISEDGTVEPNETVNLTLSAPTGGAVLGAQSTAVLTITDNDGPTVTNAVPSNGSPSVSPGTNLVLDFSMAMDPATFVSGTTVLISPDPSAGAITAANRIQFFWNVAFTQVTLSFDTKLPVGIYGDDILGSGTLYAVTLVSGVAGVKSSVGTGSIALVSDYITNFTTYTSSTNPTVTITPNVSANNPVAAGTTVFTLTWSQAMNPAQGRIQIQGNTGLDLQAQFGDVFPHQGIQSMVWSAGNTILTVTLVAGVPSNSLFRFGIDNFNGSAGGYYNQNGDIIFATPGPGGTAPTISARFPASGATGVGLDQEILIGFTAPMWPGDLLDSAKIVVSGTGINQANLTREVLDFSGVFISPNNGWPASTVITVTVNTTVRNAAGVNIAATSAASFTTAAADTTAMTIDGPYSTISTGATDLDTGGFNASLRLLRGGSNRAFVNKVSLAPRDVSLTEATAPFVPIKGYSLRGEHGVEVQSDNGFTGLTFNRGYLLTINPTFLNTNGGIMSTTAAANVVAFTTRLNSGAVARPVIFGGDGDSKYSTKPGDVEADLRLDVSSPTSTPLTVTAADGTFTPTLTSSGGQSYDFQSSGNETGLATAGNRTLTFTVSDVPTGTHTITMKNKMYVFDTTIFPTLSTPAGSATPTLSWTALTAPMQIAAPAFAIGVVKQGASDPTYIVLQTSTATSFTLPADQALSPGTYYFLLHFFRPTDGTFKGASMEGETVGSGTFIVP